MSPTGGISQTPSTPLSDKFCIFCTLTSDALARLFQYPSASEIPPPDENISSEKSLSRVAHSSDGSDQPPSAPDGFMASASIDNYFISKSELQTKSQEHLHKTSNGVPFDSSDSYLSRNPILSGSRSPVNLRNIHCNKIEEPVVFAEMNQMLTRVGIKLERSAPPSRRGSPPRAGTPSNENHVSPSGHVSPTFPTGLTSYVNYDRMSSPVTIYSGSHSIPRSINEDLLVTGEGDAHLLRLQQACQEQMNEPSFSRRESVEGGAISSYDDDAHSLSLKPIQNHINEGKISPHLSEKGNSKSDDVKNGEERSKKEEQLSNKSIDRSQSGGSSSASFLSSSLMYSASTSHASPLSSMCITPLSHSSSNSAGGKDRDDCKMVNVSIAYSEVLQLQGKAAEAAIVVETLLKDLENTDSKFASTYSAADRDIGVRSAIGTLTLSTPSISPYGSDKRLNNRIPSPTFSQRSNVLGPDASSVPVSGHVMQNMPSSDHSVSKDRINHQIHLTVCYRRLGVLYKVLGRLSEAEKSLESYISLKKEMETSDNYEFEGRNDIANAYCLLATIVDEMAGRSEDALEYERLALELMANNK